jgi:serine/threonine-protein kinase
MASSPGVPYTTTLARAKQAVRWRRVSTPRRRFRILQEIAEGGFGKVFLAEQISPDGFSRIVAVKLLHAKWSQHDEVVMRTRDEARLLGLIRHQHIVKVEDLTSIDGKCALVMEYLEGVDLKWLTQFMRDKQLRFPRAAALEIAVAVASALDAAWNGVPLQGGEPLRVIHRDIKPSNVFVTLSGGVKVLDFGTARANFAEREARTQAISFGSQGYMAPERTLGGSDTPAADVFSLGVTLYEILRLDGFGRVHSRPLKFAAALDERLGALDLGTDEAWANGVRTLLREMLQWESKDRPAAAQVAERAEDLAQGAHDDGLRRLCRTVVTDAKAALPAIEDQDAITGTIVDEDPSAPHRTVPPPPVLRTMRPADRREEPAGVRPPPETVPSPPPPPPPGSSTLPIVLVTLAVGMVLVTFGVAVVAIAAGSLVWFR